MRRTTLPVLAAAGALLAAAAPAAAQRSDPTLERVDSLLAATRITEARTTLERWLASPTGRTAEGDVAAQALLLRGRLTTSADTALPLYLELALNFPASRFAPDALLRLGQGYLALGEVERADGYLQRLVRDYPAFEQRATALLWLARAQFARRRDSDACRTLQLALAGSDSAAPLTQLLRQENAACTGNRTAPPPARTAADAQGAYTIQIGAFRDYDAAQALARRLRSRDIDARVVRIGDGSLAMVRAGRFEKRADATELLRRVRTIVPDAVITGDVARERTITR